MIDLETIAVILGLANIVLVVRRSLWNYPFGIAMVSLYFFIFADAKLYSDALLQIFFLTVQLYGWWNWIWGRDAQGAVIVRHAGAGAMLGWIGAILAGTALWGWLMHRYTDAALPWWDASIAMTSIAAQILLSRRFIENWPLWVATDAIAVGVYAAKDLDKTAMLYAVFLVIAAWGWWDWLRAGRAQHRAVPAQDSPA